jgi:hypothetical protein
MRTKHMIVGTNLVLWEQKPRVVGTNLWCGNKIYGCGNKIRTWEQKLSV